MYAEKTIKAIEKWYDGDSFEIGPISTSPTGSSEGFEQSDDFISVVGWQNEVGNAGDTFEGAVYFEYESGKFITTRFYS